MSDFLARYNQSDGRTQSLHEHSMQVSEFCYEFGKAASIGHIAKLAGLLHDIGKAKQEFQDYLGSLGAVRRGSVNHTSCGACFMEEIDSIETREKRLLADIVSLVISSHHHSLRDILDSDGRTPLDYSISLEEKELYQSAKNNFLQSCVKSADIAVAYQEALSEIKGIVEKLLIHTKEVMIGQEDKYKASYLNFNMGLLTKYIFSCLVDADWLDAALFEQNRSAAEAKKEINQVPPWDEYIDKLDARINRFKKINELSLLREEISVACKGHALLEPAIYRLFAPTGGGKTISSLRYALNHAQEYSKKRIIYVVPFKTIIEQNAKVIKEIIGEEAVLEYHSDVIQERDGENEQISHATLLASERWDKPIVLTTMVQFLDSIFSLQRSRNRRMHQLSDAVLIFDEIQSLPIKCTYMFNATVNFLSQIGNSTAVLCTATQPSLTNVQYPIKLGERADIVSDADQKSREFKRTELVDARIIGGYSNENLSYFIEDKIVDKNSLLLIVNTKSVAADIFKRLRDNLNADEYDLYHLSTNMCASHRSEIIENMKSKLSLTTVDKKVICISTQLIEAGVDISFDCVVRSLTGLDSIAQAAGRCNRHGEYQIRQVFIVNSADENLDKLPEMRHTQKVTERVLDEFKQAPDFFGGDLLSPQAIEYYYKYFYAKQEENMGYHISKFDGGNLNFNLFDLLSDNEEGRKAYADMHENQIYNKRLLRQSFETSGRNFSVIDGGNISILVPYSGKQNEEEDKKTDDRYTKSKKEKNGKEIIEALHKEKSFSGIKKLLQQAQKYTVSVYEKQKNKLDEISALETIEGLDILVLDKRYYDENLGITIDKTINRDLYI